MAGTLANLVGKTYLFRTYSIIRGLATREGLIDPMSQEDRISSNRRRQRLAELRSDLLADSIVEYVQNEGGRIYRPALNAIDIFFGERGSGHMVRWDRPEQMGSLATHVYYVSLRLLHPDGRNPLPDLDGPRFLNFLLIDKTILQQEPADSSRKFAFRF